MSTAVTGPPGVHGARVEPGPARTVAPDASFCLNLLANGALAKEILALRPDVYAKAGDYTLEKLEATERAALQKVESRIEFMPFLAGFSTTALIAKIKAATSASDSAAGEI